MSARRAAVFGAGAWGTALALVLARAGCEVTLVARDPARAAELAARRENRRYLPGVRLPDRLRPTADIARAAQDAGLVVVALPCAAIADTLHKAGSIDGHLVIASKGIDPDTLERVDEIAARHLPPERWALLSGPSFAIEVAQRKPTAIVMAAASHEIARAAADWFADPAFRVYTSDDPIGVALGGALKNVVAIAAGAAEGMGLGHNAVAAVVTRGLAEIARIAERCGGRRETLMGLAGLGDLVLTCTGGLSRNRRLGFALAEGARLDEAIGAIGQVVEGVRTARAARRLAARLDVEAPLIEAVADVVDGRVSTADAVRRLLARPERPEDG